MSVQYSIVGGTDESIITVFISGHDHPYVAHSDHPNFARIEELARANDASVSELFDVAQTAAENFSRLSERVTAANGRLYLDGDEVNNALTHQVLRFIDDGVDDWRPLVNFFEKVQSNPSEHSRDELYVWLTEHDFTITDDGDIIAYKGVTSGSDGGYTSIHQGRAIVDGVVHTGRIPNAVGSTVEMPRTEVVWDPAGACLVGLHVGTFAFASNFGHGTTLTVKVNPRDVVSVPTDANAQKMRVCRYTVTDIATQQIAAPVLFSHEDYDEDDDYGWVDED